MKRFWLFVLLIVVACTTDTSGPTAVPVTIVVTNDLIDPVTIYVNDIAVGITAASATQQVTVNVAGSLTVSFDLNRPITTGGTPLGEQMFGDFETISNPSGTYTFIVDNFVGTQEYFAPLISNSGAYPIIMAVNSGLASEYRCNCTAPSGGLDVNIGYYRLFGNTEVRGYRSVSGYGNGTYTFWNVSTFGPGVQDGSGVVLLANSANLLSPPIGAAGVAGTVTRGTGRPTLGRALTNTP